MEKETKSKRIKKVLKIISISIFILGILIGSGIITAGIIKTNELKDENKKITESIENKYSTVTSIAAQEKMISYIKTSEEKIKNLESEINSLSAEKNQIFMKEQFSTKYYEKDTELKNKREEKISLESTSRYYTRIINDIRSGEYDKQMKKDIKNETKDETEYRYLYYIGFIVILSTCLISGILFLIIKYYNK